jgi:biotin carboxylase
VETPRHVLILGIYSPVADRLWDADVATSLMCDRSLLHRERGLTEHRSLTVTDGAGVLEQVDLAARIHQVHPLTHAVGMDDASMYAAALIRDRLGLEGGNPPEVVDTVHDKQRYRATLTRAGLSQIQHAPAATVEDVVRFGDRHGWPVVVKPVQGSGSTGVTTDVTSETAQHAWTRATARSGDTPTGRAVVEQQARGHLVTVDTFSHNGEHRVLMTGFELVGNPHPVIMCSGVPAPLTPEQHAKVGSTVTAALTALGVLTGPAHTEVLVDGQDVFLVETQLRPGGDFPELTQAVTGLDAYQLWADQLLGGNPLPSIDRARPPERATAALVVYPSPDLHGELVEILNLEAAGQAAGVFHVQPNPTMAPRLAPVRTIADRSVALFATGETPARALRRALSGASRIRLRVRQDPHLPATGRSSGVDVHAASVTGR